MSEHCCVCYAWKGRGWTQEISWVRIQGEEVLEWKGKLWSDFLNYMSQEQWELTAAAPLEATGAIIYGVVAYFHLRSCFRVLGGISSV